MEWVETTGRTIEEAKDAALDELGVDEQDAEFEVLEEPKVGLFGRLRSEARVRARVRPTRPRAKEERRDRRKRGERKGRGSNEQGGERGGERAGERARNDDKGRRSGESGTSDEAGPRMRRADKERGTEVEGDRDVPLAEQAGVAETFLAGLLAEFGAQGSIETRSIDDETTELAVTGTDLGLLIGQKGSTLSAVQDLTRTVVQRQTGARNGRLIIDVAGYRQKRREALERFTQEVVAAVQASGERRVLEPMHPADRKVVHDTVNTLPGVRTISEGEEPRRRVVILPESDT